jgi:hypothetical protein
MVDPSAPPQMLASLEERSREPREEKTEAEEPKHHNMDEEAAPLTATGELEAPRRHQPSGPRKFGPLFWAGLAVAVVGAGGIALGIAGDLIAKQQSDAVAADSRKIDPNTGKPFLFNDPTANGQDDNHFQSKGQLWNTIGIAGTVAGGVLVAAGVTMLAIDVVKHPGRTEREKPRRRPASEESSRTPWYVAPAAGPRFVGAGAGLSF